VASVAGSLFFAGDDSRKNDTAIRNISSATTSPPVAFWRFRLFRCAGGFRMDQDGEAKLVVFSLAAFCLLVFAIISLFVGGPTQAVFTDPIL
jgi:hypothetical protein